VACETGDQLTVTVLVVALTQITLTPAGTVGATSALAPPAEPPTSAAVHLVALATPTPPASAVTTTATTATTDARMLIGLTVVTFVLVAR
jgi:hypothetical protein